MGDSAARGGPGRTNSEFSGRSYAQRHARSESSLRSASGSDHPNAPGNGPDLQIPHESLDRGATHAPKRSTFATPEQTVPKTSACSERSTDIRAESKRTRSRRIEPAALPASGELRGDLRFDDADPPRAFLKLDRLGGDLFGLNRAANELGAGVGCVIAVRGSAPDGDSLEHFRVLSVDTGRAGELELRVGDMKGARTQWSFWPRVSVCLVQESERAA